MTSIGSLVPRAALADRLALTKPRITAMVVFTTGVGFLMASRGPLRPALLAAALVGTGLVAAGRRGAQSGARARDGRRDGAHAAAAAPRGTRHARGARPSSGG